MKRLLVRVKRSFFEPAWREMTLEPGTYLIGRSPEAHILLPDRLVSRRHARISYFDGKWYIQDIGSRNGTYVKGEDIRGKGPIPIPDSGLEVLLGTTILELKPLEDIGGERETSKGETGRGKAPSGG